MEGMSSSSLLPQEQQQQQQQRHNIAIVLFYKYFGTTSPQESNSSSSSSCCSCYQLLVQYPNYYLQKLQLYCKTQCSHNNMKGRILLSCEGINGTLSAANKQILQQFIDSMENLDLVRGDLGYPPTSFSSSTTTPTPNIIDIDDDDNNGDDEKKNHHHDGTTTHTGATVQRESRQSSSEETRKSSSSSKLFQNIDWKISCSNNSDDDNGGVIIMEPFPDLKVSIVKEIISTGGNNNTIISMVEAIQQNQGGKHLSPQEFHETIEKTPSNKLVLIDVRNTFEYNIGHFVHPNTQQPAINPQTTTFSAFDTTFCAKNRHITDSSFQNKKVLMYCTGGIRCEKASVMLKRRGFQDVSQLSGGIHRYLETYGNTGYFRGKNFVFDQRVAQLPSQIFCNSNNNDIRDDNNNDDNDVVVGQCLECQCPFDEICGSRVCTVCRDLVLICSMCQNKLREYHCDRHASWKHCYYTFLGVFDRDQLMLQRQELFNIRDSVFIPACEHKNVRRTLSRQIQKVAKQIEALDNGMAVVDRDAPQRCRTCMEKSDICDGKCWGFWKTRPSSGQTSAPTSSHVMPPPSIRPIDMGDHVEPGPNWNTLRLGSTTDQDGQILRGQVVEIKTWAAGSNELDCVAVKWENRVTAQPLIYRWGAIVRNGSRAYDLQHMDE